MLDHHLHVWPHERGTPPPTVAQLERYCEAAAANGITEIAITEHCHRFTRIADEVFPHWDRPTTGPLAEASDHILEVEAGGDLDTYVDVLLEAQQRGLPVLVGMEVDHLPGTAEAMAGVLDDYPFDILLGSVHWLDDWLFDAYGIEVFGAEWQTRDTDDVFSDYVDAVLEIANTGMIDVLAHIDVIKIAGYLPERLEEHERRLVDGVAAAGVAVELSSAGLQKPVADTYPSGDLLDLLVEAGVPLTTASDAHVVDQVGRDMDRLAAELDRRGVDTLATFRRRERRAYRRHQQ